MPSQLPSSNHLLNERSLPSKRTGHTPPAQVGKRLIEELGNYLIEGVGNYLIVEAPSAGNFVIVSTCAAAARSWEIEVPRDWIFTDEGYTGASLVRPALERLRDLAAQVPVDVVICLSPDRLARKLAYQTLLT